MANSTRVLTLSLGAAELVQLKAKARAEGLSVAALIRVALNGHLEADVLKPRPRGGFRGVRTTAFGRRLGDPTGDRPESLFGSYLADDGGISDVADDTFGEG